MEEIPKPSKIEITNWPLSKNGIAVTAIVISFLSVFFTIFWSVHTNNELKKTQEAKVILSNPIVSTVENPDNKDQIRVNLELALENIG